MKLAILSDTHGLLRPEVIQGLLTVIFGVFLVIDGMVTLQDGIDCARAKLGGWWVLAALAVSQWGGVL